MSATEAKDADKLVYVIEKGSPAEYFVRFDYGAGEWTADFHRALRTTTRAHMQRLWDCDRPIFTIFNDDCRIAEHMICVEPQSECVHETNREVFFARKEGVDWEIWPKGAMPHRPAPNDAPFVECAHQPEHGACAQWGGVHFHAIRFGDGNSPWVWDAVNGWRSNLRHQSCTQPPTLPFEVVQLRETAKSFRASGDQGTAHLMERSADLLEMASAVAADAVRHQVNRQSPGAEAIAAERIRQMEAEKWSTGHDDDHDSYQLSSAAMAYIEHAKEQGPSKCVVAKHVEAQIVGRWWPWDMGTWKPRDPRRNLVRAGALIAAEIDRLDRAASLEFVAGKKP